MNCGALYYLGEIVKPHTYCAFDLVRNKKKEIRIPNSLRYLSEYTASDKTNYSFFQKYYKFGDAGLLDPDKFVAEEFDCVLVTTFAFCYFEGLKELIEYIRKFYRKPIIVGGSGVSSNPGYYLDNLDIDFAVKGPAELSLCKILDSIEEGREVDYKGVFSKEKRTASDNCADYSFKPYVFLRGDTLMLQLTRGCPKDCAYCSIKLNSGDVYRKSPTDLLESALQTRRLDGAKVYRINFEDDNLTYDWEYFENVMEILKKNVGSFTFSFENGVDFTTLDERKIYKLIESGISQWNLSLTSVNYDTLKNSKRNYILELYDSIMNIIEKYNLPVITYFISGLIGDKSDNILATILYLAGKRTALGISSFYPVPNTKAVLGLKEEIVPELAKGSSFYKWGDVSTKKLITLFMLSRFVNSIKTVTVKEWMDFSVKIFKKNADFYITGAMSDKTALSKTGILVSIINEDIYYCCKVGEEYIFRKRDLDDQIIKRFFFSIKNDIIIKNSGGEVISGEIWSGLWEKAYRS
ncbi:MAG TPA: radical SAM protein [Spirochaetota bacterium]|nr:radical SAM protein [Spirochaetota bacterium]